MISGVIYFIDSWVKSNIGPDAGGYDPESLARRCMDDAVLAGFSNDQIEQDLGTDLIDFMTSELQFRSEKLARGSLPLMETWQSDGVGLANAPPIARQHRAV